MADAPGQDPGHPPPGLTWAAYIDWLVDGHGSLAGAAARLAALRGYVDDAESIERALRRLRGRGDRPGGVWGERALAAFGLPAAASERLRWMGSYHARFTDLPVAVCLDLLRAWDRPPVNEGASAHVWLALAHASCALRAADVDGGSAHLARARAASGRAEPAARAELLLAEAFVASRRDPDAVPGLLAAVAPLLDQDMPEHDRACLRARWIDQRAYELNHARGGLPPDHAGAEELYWSLPDDGAPPFARCRRANGLAYARWRFGDPEAGAAHARAAADHAGDGGHVRLRAMAHTMLARIVGGAEGAEARRRAVAIASWLDDEQLRLRFARPVAANGPSTD
jgi:hypothetical protein